MSRSIRSFLFAIAFLLVTFPASAQNIRLKELLTSFSSPEYPQSLFEMLEAKGFERIDKQYDLNCERAIYAYPKSGSAAVFFNPMLCRKAYLNEMYPVKSKNELELQFQKRSRPYFANLCAQIKKECKPLPGENGKVTEKKSKGALQAYYHKETGITILVKGPAPVAYIYLLK